MVLDFTPSEELKKLQQVELGLFKEFRRVCRKYGLKYFASGGTLLGAARHRGFIPWDDDMDVQMMWSDYQVLMEVAPDEFREPFFYQTYKNDLFGELSNCKLRRADTTGVTEWEFANILDPAHNRGIFFDVFPLFSIPESNEILALQKQRVMETWKAYRGWLATQNNDAGFSSAYEQFIPDYLAMKAEHSIEEIKQMYLDACLMEEGETEEIGMTSFRTHNEKFIWKREWFRETVELPFEDTTISCPKYYDEVLRKQYGDWTIPVYNAAMHQMHLFDPQTPYSRMPELLRPATRAEHD